MPSSASCCITSSTSPTSSGSSALVGSSNSITFGFIASARAIATRCCWPPESCAGYASSLSPSPTFCSSAGLRCAPDPPEPASRTPALPSRSERGAVREQVEALEHHADLRAQLVDAAVVPADHATPRSRVRRSRTTRARSCSAAASTCPSPTAPMMQTTSPLPISRLTSSSTRLVPNDFDRLRTVIICARTSSRAGAPGTSAAGSSSGTAAPPE